METQNSIALPSVMKNSDVIVTVGVVLILVFMILPLPTFLLDVLLTLDINPTDMGYVIGRRGQTAQAIRTLLKIVGAKNNARVNLKINEPEGSQRPAPRAPRTADADVDTSSVDDLKI